MIGTGVGSIAIPFIQSLMPYSTWITLENLTIGDVVGDECPTMVIQRQINKSFVGFWSYSLFEMEDQGTESPDDDEMVLVASRSGERDYLVSEPPAFPVRITNRLGMEVCPLEPGRYVMFGRIRPEVWFWVPSAATVQSNVFTVYPKE